MKHFRLFILLLPFLYLVGCSNEKEHTDHVTGDSAHVEKNAENQGGPGGIMDPRLEMIVMTVHPDSIAKVKTNFWGTKKKGLTIVMGTDTTYVNGCPPGAILDTTLAAGTYHLIPHFFNGNCNTSGTPLNANASQVSEHTRSTLSVAYKHDSMPSDSTFIAIVMEKHPEDDSVNVE